MLGAETDALIAAAGTDSSGNTEADALAVAEADALPVAKADALAVASGTDSPGNTGADAPAFAEADALAAEADELAVAQLESGAEAVVALAVVLADAVAGVQTRFSNMSFARANFSIASELPPLSG